MGVSLGVARAAPPSARAVSPVISRRQGRSVKFSRLSACSSAQQSANAVISRWRTAFTPGAAGLRTQPRRSPPQARSTRSRMVLASWGADVQFEEASVVDVKKAGTNMWSLTLDVGPISEGYSKAGQFIQAKVGESKPGFFAIASPPSTDNNTQGLLQLLVKKAGETAEMLCALSSGDKVSVSNVMGKGFPVENIPADEISTILIFATGSGISPIKALIESGSLETDKRGNVTLYYGATDTEAMACAAEIKGWEKLGVKVVPVLSSEGKGYVQDVFLAEALAIEASGTAAVLCGQKEMAMAITEVLTGKGVPKEKILTNF